MKEPGGFAGDLGLLSLFDLGQLLMLNGATGVLEVEHGEWQGRLYFQGGRIVNASDGDLPDGENAAYHIFTWRSGRFEFRPNAVSGPRPIQEGTEALMLEAARRLDESGAGVRGAGSGQEAQLRDRRSSMEALRDAFHLVAREAGIGNLEAAAEPASLLLQALRDADDRLLLREGRAPRLYHDGSWLLATDQPLSNALYTELRARLLGEREPGEGASPVLSRTMALEGGGAVAATRLLREDGEALWVRLARLPAPDPALLDGPLDLLRALLDAPQHLVLVGGPAYAAVERLTHAMVALLARRRPGAVVLGSDVPAYEHGDQEAVVLAVPQAGVAEALSRMAPAAAVFDAVGPSPQAVVLALRLVPWVGVGVIGADASGLAERWLAGLGEERVAALRLANSVPIAAIYSPGVAMGEDRIPFVVSTASPGTIPGHLTGAASPR